MPTNLEKRYINVPFEVDTKALDDYGMFSGYGSVFGVIDAYGERVMPGAFEKSIEEKGAAGVALLWQHRADEPIGVWTQMREDAKGLYVEGKLAMNTTRGKEAYELMKMGWKAGLSIGFVPRDVTSADDDGVREVREVDLWETSIVTFPANQASMVEQIRARVEAGEEPTKRELERLLTRDAGLSRSKAAALLASGYDAMTDTRDAGGEAMELLKELDRIFEQKRYPDSKGN